MPRFLYFLFFQEINDNGAPKHLSANQKLAIVQESYEPIKSR